MLYYITSYHTIPYHNIIIPYHSMLYCILVYHITLCCIILCRALRGGLELREEAAEGAEDPGRR